MTEALFDPASLAAFPTGPGVYLMKDRAGDVIYVGKAANLRNRVRNYFTRSGDNRFSVQFLRRQVAAVECIVTANEKEAFLLENTLIKDRQPRYNIRLRDDKTFLSLRFRMNHDFPRLETVRVRPGSGDMKRGGRDDLYFGPFTSPLAVRETLKFLLKVFPVRTCKDSVFRNRTRPCLLYDVGKCCAPCVLPVPREEYDTLVRRVTQFLRGHGDEVREVLAARMADLSEALEFEKAALVRDRIAAMDETLEKQRAHTLAGADRDVAAVVSRQGRSLVVLHRYRDGALVDSREFYTRNYEQEDGEVLYSFLSQHYADRADIPPQVVVTADPADRELLEEWLREKRGGAVGLHVPRRGELVRLAATAAANAEQALARRLAGERSEGETLAEVARRLGLAKPPASIECVDISNIMGTHATGSLVRFEDGRPAKAGYRLFRIRTVEGANDFAMMREVLSRRFRPEGSRAAPPPDLLMVDGGKGQLAVATEVFRELGVTGVALASIAKSKLKEREFGAGAEETLTPEMLARDEVSPKIEGVRAEGGRLKVKFRTEERIFLPGRKNPVTFSRNSPALFLLQRVRDEAHRFAITHHKRLRQKAGRRSVLDGVPGIGAVRKKALLRHFGSLAALREASCGDIAGVPGVGAEAARAVYEFLRSGGPERGEIPPAGE